MAFAFAVGAAAFFAWTAVVELQELVKSVIDAIERYHLNK